MAVKIKVRHKGNFNKTERFMARSLRSDYMRILSDYGQHGVQLLQEATPKDSGETANSWNYEIIRGRDRVTLAWTNSHESEGVNVAILIIYGHALWNGGFVQGNDFVSPAMRPVFQELADRVWKEVTE